MKSRNSKLVEKSIIKDDNFIWIGLILKIYYINITVDLITRIHNNPFFKKPASLFTQLLNPRHLFLNTGTNFTNFFLHVFPNSLENITFIPKR